MDSVIPVTTPIQDQLPSSGLGDTRWHRRPANRTVTFVSHLFLVVIGIFFMVTGYNGWAAVQPFAGGKTAVGIVVSVVDGESCGRYGCSPNWTPTIRFETPAGDTHTFEGPTYGSQINRGQTVKVSYNAANPADAHDVSASDGDGLLLIGFGVFAAVLGVGSTLLGVGAIQRRIGLLAGRDGSGWVGHRVIHSNFGVAAIAAVFVALAVVGLFVI